MSQKRGWPSSVSLWPQRKPAHLAERENLRTVRITTAELFCGHLPQARLGQQGDVPVRLCAEKSSNVVDHPPQGRKGTAFLEYLERFFRVNTEFFRPQRKVRSNRGNDQAFFARVSVCEPKNRAVAEQEELLRRCDPLFGIEVSKLLLELALLLAEARALADEFFIADELAVA